MSFIKKTDNIISLMILIVGIFYGYHTYRLPQFLGIIGAAFFPKILTIAIILLCLLFLLVNSRYPEEGASSVSISDIQAQNLVKPVVAVSLIGAYAYSLFHFGFKIPTFIFLNAMTLIYGEKNWKKVVLISLIATIIFDIIFRVIFKVPIREIQIF